MTSLALAARNFLAQQSSVTSLLGSDPLWSTWIFTDSPQALVENSGTCLIVISEEGGWAGANDYNTARFPRLQLDIWADPTRNPDGSVQKLDAKLKIEAVYKSVDKYLHLVDNSLPGGVFHRWGTAAQIAGGTAHRIISSKRSGEPNYSPTFDNKGGQMARLYYNVEV